MSFNSLSSAGAFETCSETVVVFVGAVALFRNTSNVTVCVSQKRCVISMRISCLVLLFHSHRSPVTRLVPVGLAPPPRHQTDRDLLRTNDVGVALAYGAYATV